MIPTTNWTQESGYPQYSSDEAGWKLVDKYIVENLTVSQIMEEMPIVGSFYDSQEIEELIDLRLKSITMNPMPGGTQQHVTFNYSPPTNAGMSGGSNESSTEPEWTMTVSEFYKPIGTHPDYKMIWNHYLLKHKDSVMTFPSVGYATQTVDQLTAAERDNNFAWARSTNEKSKDWYAFIPPTIKSDLDEYLLPSIVVNERLYFKNRNRAIAEEGAQLVGKRVVPAETFGLASDNTKWLLTSADLQPNGDFWVLTRQYQYADDVSTLIYAAG